MPQPLAEGTVQINVRGVPKPLRDWFNRHVGFLKAQGDEKASVNHLVRSLMQHYAEVVQGERAAEERRVPTRR